MKLHTLKNRWLLPALSCAALAMTSQSKAAVIVTFEQVGADVVTTWSGSLDPGLFAGDGNLTHFDRSQSTFRGLRGVTVPDTVDLWTSGLDTFTTLNEDGRIGIVGGSYGSFGFIGTNFYLSGSDNDVADTAIIDFTSSHSTLTYVGQYLADIGAASFNNTLAWTSFAGGTNTVSYTTIPEPSAFVLGGLGVAGLILRRRR